MKRKIIKYLKNKDESEYNDLDKLLVLYLNGKLDEILNKYDFTKIDIYVSISKKWNNLQISALYYNLGIGIDFFDMKYEYFTYNSYRPDILLTDADNKVNIYNKDFNIENLLDEIFDLVIHDERLNNERENIATMSHSDMRNYSKKFGKKKIYKIISYICLMLPIIIACGVGTYVLFSGEKQYFHPIVYVLFLLPIVFYLFFNYKSKK